MSKSDTKLKFSNRDIDYKKLILPIEELENSKIKMKCSQDVKEFLKPLIPVDTSHQFFINSKTSESLLFASPQDKATLDKGREILDKMSLKLLKSNEYRQKNNFEDFVIIMDQVDALNSEYLEVIPKVNPEMISTMLNEYQIKMERDMLDTVYSFAFQIRIVLGAYQHLKKVNPYDYIMGTFDLDLESVESGSNDEELVLNYLNSSKSSNCSLVNLMKVKGLKYEDKEDKKFLNTDKHIMLWHGTPATNILSIMKKGLKIKPNESTQHGSAYGNGIYLSDSFELSQCYSAPSGDYKYILLCEVALGN